MKWNIARVAVVIAATTLLIVLSTLWQWPWHALTLKTYFTDGMGLRAGAPVRVAGVDVGSVKSVRPRAELKQAPVEVILAIRTDYELRIPDDSVASLSTSGILGPTYVNIDARNASGLPIRSGGTLKANPVTSDGNPTIEQILNRLAIAINPDATAESLDKLEALIKERCGGTMKDEDHGALKRRGSNVTRSRRVGG
jgi:phospholipid/cholesterol/gamma-HCH transport system substrate-binding protein